MWQCLLVRLTETWHDYVLTRILRICWLHVHKWVDRFTSRSMQLHRKISSRSWQKCVSTMKQLQRRTKEIWSTGSRQRWDLSKHTSTEAFFHDQIRPLVLTHIIFSLLFISDRNSESMCCHQHYGTENISHWSQYSQIQTTGFGNRTPVPLIHGQWFIIVSFCGTDSYFSMTLFWICMFL